MARETCQGNNYHHVPPSDHFDSADAHPPKRRKTEGDGGYRSAFNKRCGKTGSASQSQPSQQSTSHTKNERKTNPSSRIYSIRKLLDRGELPPNIKIEKERELASLLYDQQKTKMANERKKMISRYHMVRFLDRKTATKKLKNWTKERDAVLAVVENVEKARAGPSKSLKTQLKQIDIQIRDATIDLNYCLYAPLAEKYISIFPSDRDSTNKDIYPSSMKKQDQALLSNEQRADLVGLKPQIPGVLRIHDRSSLPPLWFEIEQIMYPTGSQKPKPENSGAEIEDKTIKQKLEDLRDGKIARPKQDNPGQAVFRNHSRKPKDANNDNSANTGTSKRKRPPSQSTSHATKDKKIHVEHDEFKKSDTHADGENYGNHDMGGVSLQQPDVGQPGNESDSDGDGGFFER